VVQSENVGGNSFDLQSGGLPPWRLDHFNKDLFWEEPLEGLYEVDVGIRPPPVESGETGNNLMAFADLNNDKYTDIITVSDGRTAFTIHLYEPLKKMFLY
jgi:hypothetical protein